MRLITHDYFITVEVPCKGGMLSTVFRLGAVPIGEDTTALDRAVRALFGRRAKAVKIEPVTKAKPKRKQHGMNFTNFVDAGEGSAQDAREAVVLSKLSTGT